MKAKRILAMVLSVALVATSGDFSLSAYAKGSGEAFGAAGYEILDVSGAVSGADATDPDVTEGDVTGSDVTEGDITGGDVTDGDATGGDATDGDVTGGDATDGDVTGSDVTEGDVTGSDVTGGDASDGNSVGQDIVVDSEYFAITEDGTLKLKDGVELSSLKGEVNLPKEAKKIPKGIFNQNSKITALVVPEDSELTEIAEGAFERSAIKTLEIPDAVTKIEAATFKDSKLQKITFSAYSNLNYIGDEAFAGSNLVTFAIPGLVKTIGTSAFKGCLEFTSVSVKSVSNVGIDAFKNCGKLKTVTWGDGNIESIGDGAFAGTGLTKLELSGSAGENITTWGVGVFEGCKSLGSAKLPSQMQEIPDSLFKDCTILSYVALPRNCTLIGEDAFAGCEALSAVTIPEDVEKISAGAFSGCQDLKEVVINQRGDNEYGESTILIAEDAFPDRVTASKMVMKGYDGTVEDYANNKGYSFVTLFPSHSISVVVNDTDYGTATLSKKSARQGEVIQVTITPATDYRLKSSTFKVNGDPITKLVEDNGKDQIFSFVMPDDDARVVVDFEKSTTSYGTLQASFETYGDHIGWTWEKKGGKSKKGLLTIDKPGMAVQLQMQGRKSSRVTQNLGVWLFDYKSQNTDIAKIDETGVIYACGQGTTKITASLKNKADSEVTFEVTVSAAPEYENFKYSLEFSNIKKAVKTEEVIDGETLQVIQYTKGNLSTEDKTFTVSLVANEGNDTTNMFVDATWKSANTALTSVEQSNTLNNQNMVTVKKGVTGETAVTVTVTNGKTGKKKEVYHEESFIVRVIDATPRLVQSSITVNSLSTAGTEIELLPVYQYAIDSSSVQIVTAKKDDNLLNYEASDYLKVTYKSGKYIVSLTNAGKAALDKKGANITISNAYVEGKLSDESTFRVPIKSLVLTSKALKPSIKLTGKLNLFFNSQATAAQQGSVTLTQSLKDLKVESYELVSKENYEKEGSQPVDAFANNFVVSNSGVISRSDSDLICDAKGKVVTSGYLKITYEGYEPCYAKLTIPTVNTKPAYVLSMTKATVNTNSNGYALKLQILDKKTKKVISLADLDKLSFDESAKGTTSGLFEDLDTDAARSSDTISLVIRRAQKGKAVINVEMDTWNEPLKFTFNLSVTPKAPTVKAKTSTLTVNTLCADKPATTVLTLNQPDVELVEVKDFTYVGKDAENAANITLSFDAKTSTLSAVADASVKKGSYKFTMTPVVRYVADNQEEELKSLAITVKVIDTQLTASLKPSVVTLNSLYSGQETGLFVYTIKNMPVNEDITLVTDDVAFTGTNDAAKALVRNGSLVLEAMDDETVITAVLDGTVRPGTYKYNVSGLKVETSSGTNAEIKPFAITVKVISKAGTVKVKAAGTINPGNADSRIVYTLTTSNVIAPIGQVLLNELDTTNNKNEVLSEEDMHFDYAVACDNSGKIVGIAVNAKSNVILDAKKTYKVRVGVLFEGSEDEKDAIWTGDLTIKPKQTLPKIKTDVTSATVYAGVAAESSRRSAEVLITKTTETDAEIASVNLVGSTSATLKKAFKVSFDPDTQKAKVTLIRPDLVKANTTYNLKLEVKVIGQMENTSGAQFNLSVKVLN